MIRKYLYKYKWHYIFGLVTLFLVDMLSLFIPQFTGQITDGLKSETMSYQQVLHMIGLIVIVGACMAVGRFLWRIFIFGAARKIEYEVRNDLFCHLTGLSMRYYNEHKTGDLMAHFTNDIQAIRMSLGPAVITTFDAVIMTIMVVVKMIVYVDLKLTLIACIPMLFILIGGILYGREIEKRFDAKQKAFSDMTDQVQENISGMRVIKAFVQEHAEIRAFAKANQNNQDKNLSVIKVQAIVMPLLDLFIGCSSVAAILYGGKLVLDGTITAGKFVSFNQYILMLVWPMIAAGDSITFLSQGFASMQRIETIMKEKSEIKDVSVSGEVSDTLQGKITLSHLTFQYEKETQPVLSDLSVTIAKGETLAILGPTGSGKTTITNLLLRMYDTEDGMILLDDKEIKKYPLSELREQIAYVPQDNFLFSDTIQSNIAFGIRKLKELPYHKQHMHLMPSKKELEEAMQENDFYKKESIADIAYDDLEVVKKAASDACVHENIMEFPHQYATMVGERGVTVSGGQKQRSSIARALLKDAPILILDDALSAVDTSTEEEILKNLKANRKNKTTIIIAHRISTLQNADHILVLKDGKRAEYGTHQELLKENGIYAALYEKQQLEKQIEEA